MQDAILDKLRNELCTEIDKEAQVVYVIVLIRKHLEHIDQKKNFQVLLTYCDWVVHPCLSTNPGARDILETLDTTLASGASKAELAEALVKRYEILSLEMLRQKLRDFLDQNKLPWI